MIDWTLARRAPLPQRWQPREKILKAHLESRSPDELRRLRPDYYWLRFGQKAWLRNYARKALHPSHYQPRVPAGNPDGGQWTDEGGGFSAQHSSDVRVAANGHHYVPRGVFEKEKYSFRPETLKTFEDANTGPLRDPTSNRYDELHRQYNKAVEESLDRYLERNKIRGDQMTPDQARSFAKEILTSSDPIIRRFNMRLWMREIRFILRFGPRGTE